MLRGHITGGEYPISRRAQLVLTVAQTFQVFGTVFAFMGEQIVVLTGLRHPVVHTLLDNRIGLLGGAFVFSSIAQNSAATGAFEVYLQGEKIVSKLNKGRMPNLEEIILALANHGIAVPPQFAAQGFARPQRS